MIQKRCSKCGEVKDVVLFNTYRSYCKLCQNIRVKEWRLNNLDKVKQNIKEHRFNNYPKIKQRINEWRINNKDRIKLSNHKAQAKYRSTIKGKLNSNMGLSIWLSLRNNKQGRHWEQLVGYTVQDLQQHLENKFTEGMTWNNYREWHIDHIIPISLWEYEKPEDREFKQCWCLANLQPLWAIDNFKKGNRI